MTIIKLHFISHKNPSDKTDYPIENIMNDHIKQFPL